MDIHLHVAGDLHIHINEGVSMAQAQNDLNARAASLEAANLTESVQSGINKAIAVTAVASLRASVASQQPQALDFARLDAAIAATNKIN
jgi:glycerol-3-phosphate O-acyltransferase